MARDRDLVQEISRENAAIRSAIRDIRVELARLRGESGPGHQTGLLCGMLRMFRHHLKRHFELEEEGGFLDESTSLDPGTLRTVAELVAQHRDLEQKLAGLLDAVERAEDGRVCLSDEFVEGLTGFLTALLEHEHVENELIQKLVYQDLGVGD